MDQIYISKRNQKPLGCIDHSMGTKQFCTLSQTIGLDGGLTDWWGDEGFVEGNFLRWLESGISSLPELDDENVTISTTTTTTAASEFEDSENYMSTSSTNFSSMSSTCNTSTTSLSSASSERLSGTSQNDFSEPPTRRKVLKVASLPAKKANNGPALMQHNLPVDKCHSINNSINKRTYTEVFGDSRYTPPAIDLLSPSLFNFSGTFSGENGFLSDGFDFMSVSLNERTPDLTRLMDMEDRTDHTDTGMSIDVGVTTALSGNARNIDKKKRGKSKKSKKAVQSRGRRSEQPRSPSSIDTPTNVLQSSTCVQTGEAHITTTLASPPTDIHQRIPEPPHELVESHKKTLAEVLDREFYCNAAKRDGEDESRSRLGLLDMGEDRAVVYAISYREKLTENINLAEEHKCDFEKACANGMAQFLEEASTMFYNSHRSRYTTEAAFAADEEKFLRDAIKAFMQNLKMEERGGRL